MAAAKRRGGLPRIDGDVLATADSRAMHVAVAVSGRGSNLDALLRTLGPDAPARVVLVVSDRRDAPAQTGLTTAPAVSALPIAKSAFSTDASSSACVIPIRALPSLIVKLVRGSCA